MNTTRQLVSFAAIGLVSTLAYALLYVALREETPAAVANASALALTTVGNTAANRRLTFGVRDRRTALRDQLGGFTALAVALIITTASVLLLHSTAPAASRAVELAVLICASGLATVIRFVVLRAWISRDRALAAHPAPATVRIGRTLS